MNGGKRSTLFLTFSFRPDKRGNPTGKTVVHPRERPKEYRPGAGFPSWQLVFLFVFCVFFPVLWERNLFEAWAETPRENPAPSSALARLPGVMINLSDFGATDMAYLSLPLQVPKGGVILVHGKWGLEEGMKQFTHRFAKEGFVALAVDLFNGQTADDPEMAEDLVRTLHPESAETTLQAAVRFLKESPRFHVDHVGLVGWGNGATVLLEVASRLKDVDALVVFYPEGISGRKFEEPAAPVCGIFGLEDSLFPPETARQFMGSLEKVNKETRAYFFPGAHDFADPKSAHWRPGVTEKALQTTWRFLEDQYSRHKRKRNGFWKELFGSLPGLGLTRLSSLSLTNRWIMLGKRTYGQRVCGAALGLRARQSLLEHGAG
ncbi:putative Carboxymethylenebutenolidase [Candidatus Methylacidithermus pantelleriae]|uniref:Putative Carboxymethylenebutenolidase n=1 Tax=Candidatus Methylacidithermus pantelleriae TaxID=2744239 RepID=A0A8J2BQG4_9BACT|nr:putative Carboxymethylenebutenolidase [Candidatus Methylacidithermus pantelleriae]